MEDAKALVVDVVDVEDVGGTGKSAVWSMRTGTLPLGFNCKNCGSLWSFLLKSRWMVL